MMDTKVYRVNIRENEPVSAEDMAAVREAGQVLRTGGLVAIPTETVYGLGGDALDAHASEKIYAAKGRPSDNPLIVHIADTAALGELCDDVPEAAYKLADAFWPGPLTMIVPKSARVPYETTGGLETVAVRFPSHPAAQAIIKASGTYVAAPSANTSGRPSPTTAAHVLEDMNGRIEMIIDGGQVGIGIESTIVDLTGEVPMILRPGYITKAMLETVLGEVAVDPAIFGSLSDGIQPRAPGMKYKHYAPKGDLTIVEGENEAVIAKINALVSEKEDKGKKVAVIATDETKARYCCDIVESIGTRNDEQTIAHNLYDILRRMDEYAVDYIYSESFASGLLGQAIMNRLLKAAGHQVIKVEK